ncbi:MAG TPA: NAD(P)/FAD-dependent oxidoreductase [Bradyrhizobium sp.]|nr:NAD(P)/FAD-dependent oxidoreductase [Bradyrhizobium sp.]
MYDAVVIGSGLGGLTAAALLSKAGRKVCVLERNHSIDGAASAFKSGSLRIEPSLHQTGNPDDPVEPKHSVLVELGLLDQIEWIPVSPFMSVRGQQVGGLFDLPVGFDPARRALAARFPRSSKGIDELFSALENAFAGVSDLTAAHTKGSLFKLLRGAFELRELIRHWRLSADEMLQRYLGDDEGAKFALAGNLAYYTDDPRRLSWPFFVMAQGGFLRSGGVYVKGGSHVLSMKLAKLVRNAGGAILTGREAVAVVLGGDGAPAAVSHVDVRDRAAEDRVPCRQILANCAPNVLAAMLPEPERSACERAYGGVPLSTSLFTAHFGVNRPPAEFGLTRYGEVRLPEWMRSLRELATSAAILASDPSDRMPLYGVANYGAIDSGLSDGGPTLVTVVGADRLDNWAGLTPQQERDRRVRWLDAFQAALDRDYPGLGSAITERQFLSARSMRDFLNTPGGAVYGFAPLPMKRGIWAGVPRSPRTPIPGIYLASSFAAGGGFTGAMGSGAAAARMATAT